MNRPATIRKALTVWMTISLFALPFASRLCAQELQERGLKAKVGATKTEFKNGAAKNVNLWAVLIGISRFKNGDQSVGGVQIQNLKSAADDAQAIFDYLRSDEGGGFSEDRILLLKDETATKDSVEQELTRLRQAKPRSEEHTSELQSPVHLVCRLLLETKHAISKTFGLLRFLMRPSFLANCQLMTHLFT